MRDCKNCSNELSCHTYWIDRGFQAENPEVPPCQLCTNFGMDCEKTCRGKMSRVTTCEFERRV